MRNLLVVAGCVVFGIALIQMAHFFEVRCTAFGDVLVAMDATQAEEETKPDIDETILALEASILRWEAIYLPVITLSVVLLGAADG